jgi:asparagine synthase (glutamine-hydrolysing)
MSDATGRWTITFNGEIYNYRSLRDELERAGCIFLTNSDTEVLINAIDRWGEAGLRKLRGMYAFALWDNAEKELWLVRDPYGIKPLYFAECNGRIWFASHARALAETAGANTKRDAAALVSFYLWGHVAEPFTWWAGIRLLPAGHVHRIKAGSMLGPSKAFAKIEDAFIRHDPRPLEKGELRDLLLDSIKHHLVSDVPIGVFLSAGVDSNIVAALVAESGANLQTVTLAFSEYAGTENDEAPLAEAAAKMLGAQHTTVTISRSEFERLFEDFLSCMDQPTIDALNTYLVSYAASKLNLKVALSGLGGDELFGGYPSFKQLPLLNKWGRRLAWLQPVGRLVEQTVSAVKIPGLPPKIAGLFSHRGDLAKTYFLRRALYLEDELDTLLDESWINQGLESLGLLSSVRQVLAPLHEAGVSEHAQIAALEANFFLRNQLLRDTDWSSMVHGVEVRVPFVDCRLLEAIGGAVSSAQPPTKADLAACSDRVLSSLSKRRKTGFGTPVQHWISDQSGRSERGLRPWAAHIHREFRTAKPDPSVAQLLSLAA